MAGSGAAVLLEGPDRALAAGGWGSATVAERYFPATLSSEIEGVRRHLSGPL